MGRTICCCGAECWTKFIAILEIIFSAIYGILTIALLVFIVVSGKDKMEEIFKENIALETYLGNSGYTELIVGTVLTLAFTSIVFIFGILLYKGAKKKNLKYLTSWQIVTVTFLVANILVQVIVRNTSILSTILHLFFLCVWTTFLVWVVQVFKRDIQLEREMEE